MLFSQCSLKTIAKRVATTVRQEESVWLAVEPGSAVDAERRAMYVAVGFLTRPMKRVVPVDVSLSGEKCAFIYTGK